MWQQPNTQWMVHNQGNGWNQPSFNPMRLNNGWGQPSNGWNQPKPLGAYNQIPQQKTSKFNPFTEYYLVSGLGSNIALDISKSQNSCIIKKKNHETQRFRIREVFSKFVIECANTGLVLAIPSMSQAKGESVIAVPAGSSSSELWELVEAKKKDGGYYIKTFCGKCLDVCEHKTTNGTPVFQYDYNGGKNQIWYLQPV